MKLFGVWKIILVKTIDKVEEVIKDIRNEKLIEYAKGE